MTLSQEYQDFLHAFYQKIEGPVTEEFLLHVQEEVGEVAQAWRGFTGSNVRKGVTNTEHDVADELADVVITALVAIIQLGYDPAKILARNQQKTEERFHALA